MEQRTTLTDIVTLLAERTSLPTSDAEMRVRQFFLTIEEALLSDSIVKIRGLGTFKLVKVDARESININTGQRFTIDQHTKVTFTPDASLRNQINKPFSEFETVILSDDISLEELDSIVVETEQENEQQAYDDVSEEIVDEPIDETQTLNTAEPSEDQMIESQTQELADERQDEKQEEVEQQMASNEEQVEAQVEEQVEEQVEAQEQDTHDLLEIKELRVETQHIQQQHIEQQNVENSHTMSSQETARLTIWESLALMIFILALMALSYTAGYNRWLLWNEQPNTTTTHHNEVPVSEAKQSQKQTVKLTSSESGADIATANTTDQKNVTVVQPVEPIAPTLPKPSKDESAKYPQIDGAQYIIVGIQGEHVIKIGDSLRAISLKYFGSKDYVKYIVLLNNIKDPDIVSVGTVLKIPKLEKREK